MANPKLPIIQTVIESYRVFFNNLGAHAKLLWFPFGLWCVLLAVEGHLGEGYDFYPSLRWGVGAIVVVPAITAWHRLIILGKNHEDSRVRYSIRKTEWIYLRRLVVFIILFGIILSVFALIGGGLAVGGLARSLPTVAGEVVQTVYNLILVAVVLVALSFYLILLPAAAINRPLSFRDGRQFWTGNLIRLSTVFLLAALPEWVINLILMTMERSTGGMIIGGMVDAYDLLRAVNYFVFITITVGVMSLAYRFLVEGRPVTLTKSTQS